jgi:uncharacterized protein (TIGR00369 family)
VPTSPVPTSPVPTDPSLSGWRLMERPGFPSVMGPLWMREEEGGAAALGMLLTEGHANMRGVAHGGMLATLMDHALGMTVLRALGGGVPLATVSLDLQFIAAARPGEFLEARGKVIRKTSSLIFIRGGIFVGEQEVLSAAGIWKVLGPPRPRAE